MDDEVQGGWRIDDATRAALRLDRVRKALDKSDWPGAVLEVEELLDESPDHPEALFLLAEALLELGDAEGARDAYQQHLKAAGPDGDKAMRAGALAGLAVASFECVELQAAVEAARKSLELAPDLGETHFYLGLALERIPGKKSDSVAAFMAAHRLDPEAYPLPKQFSEAEWNAMVAEAMSALPDAVRTFWKGVPVLLVDLPDLAELRAIDPPLTPTVSGLYDGVPPEEGDPATEKPESVRLFTGNLARLGDRAAIVSEIGNTLLHEAFNWLGVTDDEVAEES